MNFALWWKSVVSLSGSNLVLAAILVACALGGLFILLYVGFFFVRDHFRKKRDRRLRRQARIERSRANRSFAQH
jgi:hypothetical protein